MPPSLGKLIELVPLGADAYYLMREGTLGGTALSPRDAELLLVTVLAADYSEWAAVHMDGARRAGASEAQIAEAVLCAVPVAGLSAWVVGATAMDAGGRCEKLTIPAGKPVHDLPTGRARWPPKANENARPTEAHDEKRAQIIEGCATLFDKVGYHNTSMQMLAEEVGLGKPTLVPLFPSKISILYAIHDAHIMGLLSGLKHGAAEIPRMSLRAACIDILREIATHPGYVRAFMDNYQDLEGEMKDNIRTAPAQLFRTGQVRDRRGNRERPVSQVRSGADDLCIPGHVQLGLQMVPADGRQAIARGGRDGLVRSLPQRPEGAISADEPGDEALAAVRINNAEGIRPAAEALRDVVTRLPGCGPT